MQLPTLNITPCNLSFRQNDGHTEVFDVVRRRYVALTPEEWVRQHVVHALHEGLGYPIELMQVEGTIALNGMSRRCDIVVYNKTVKPCMIVECKQADVPINQKVIDQICRYNRVLQVPYLYITNGMQHVALQTDSEQQCLCQLPNLPVWEVLNG